jgi:hypothetical protein
MNLAELDYFLLDRSGIWLGLAQYMLARGGRIHAVGLDGKIMVIAKNEGHSISSLKPPNLHEEPSHVSRQRMMVWVRNGEPTTHIMPPDTGHHRTQQRGITTRE